MKFIKALYINNTFFSYIAVLCASFILSYWIPSIYPIAWLLTLVLLGLFLFDIFILFSTSEGIAAQRKLPIKLSNSDINPIQIQFETFYPFKTHIISLTYYKKEVCVSERPNGSRIPFYYSNAAIRLFSH